MPPMLVNYTNFVIGDHSVATAHWHMATFEFIIVVRMRFLVVEERSKVGYNCLDACTGHGNVITPLSSDVRC